MTDNQLSYDREYVKNYYDKKYSSFTYLPGFDREKNKVNASFNTLLRHFKISTGNYTNYLDLGCGLGIKTYILSGHFKHSVGIDFSENAIAIANLLNDKPGLEFKAMDLNNTSFNEKFDLVTAFGLSTLNVSDINILSNEIINITNKYFQNNGLLVIHSFTDFSGKAPTSWHCHTRKDLKELKKLLLAKSIKMDIFFTHKQLSFYLRHGFYHLLAEVARLIFDKRRQYFLIIRTS